jgi:glycosyltransferase involved in cell wall biosynthesis
VIPTRNRRNDLERTLRSVQSQTLTDWEVVVVDDASTDDTAEFLGNLADPRVRVERLAEPSERSVARNRGLELATSPTVLFLDDDDALRPSALEVLTRALTLHTTACASVGAAIYELDGSRRRPGFPEGPRLMDVRLELLAGWVALGGQSLMRTEMVKEVGGWEEELPVIPAEDQDLWLRLCACGPVAFIPDAVLDHRPHGVGDEASRGREPERLLISRYLRTVPPGDHRARRAASAREQLQDADLAFTAGTYRTALRATIRAVMTAPFLLRSPLIGRGISRGLANALVATLLPRAATDRLRALRHRRRAASLSDAL